MFNGVPVADPLPFPNPAIRPCQRVRVLVVDDDDDEMEPNIQQRPALQVQGRLYEIGDEPIRKAIFGQVLYGILLEAVPGKDHFARTSSEVAIKVYYRDRLRSLQGRTQENPLMEITALQFLGDTHPAILGQIECCMDSDNIYSIMRYYPGGELFDRISANNEPMDEDSARVFFRLFISALQRFQDLGIAHRDLSLENILCGHEDDSFAIIDFGMCLRLTPNPYHPGTFCAIRRQPACGKRNYIAPEVLAQEEYFEPMKVDIWAAGIILFMVLTGVPPIDVATSSDERFNMVSEGRLIEMVQSWGFDISLSALDLVQRILRPNPAERPSLTEIMAHPWMRGGESDGRVFRGRMDDD